MGNRPTIILSLFCLFALSLTAAFGTTYYVDSAGGDDNKSGTIAAEAWQTLTKVNATTFSPGDRILLKAGSVWNGEQLYPKGSGSAGNPIVVDMYDTGGKPQINGDGAHQEAVLLYNQEYWELNNLDVTNYDAAGPAIRQGVRILGEDAGTLSHIHLLDLEVHDVNGSLTTGRDQAKCNAGILLDVEGNTTPTSFDDVLIEDCSVYACQRSGIKLWSNWGYSCTNPSVTLHTNVVIRNNVVDDIAGDALCLHQVAGALAEYNVVSRSCHWTDKANAGLWTWAAEDTVIQYNEVYELMQTWDGMAFDIDGCSLRCIFQYNYSHDNDGGFVMIIGAPDCAANGEPSPIRLPFCYDNAFRYNISQRDEMRLLRFIGKVWDNYVYNNTIYVGATDPLIVETGTCGAPAANRQAPSNSYLYNNIIYNTESAGSAYDFSDGVNYVFDYNTFYGYHPASEPADAHKLTSDPKFASPGGAGLGLSGCNAYHIESDSPCRDSGMTIADNGGLDFFGNAVPYGSAADRGAHEYTEVVTLSVESSPTAGVPIEVSPADENGAADGTTTFSRAYVLDTLVELTAPAEFDGDTFARWEVDGVSQGDGVRSIAILMDSAHVATAYYTPFSFPDVPEDHWAHEEIMACWRGGIVQGYPDGLYHPDRQVSRAQMAVYTARSLAGGEEAVPAGPGEATFPDVPPDHWAFDHVEYAAANNVVEGYGDGNYHPELAVTRAQMAVFIARSIVTPTGEAGLEPYEPPTEATFPDVPVGFWCYVHVEYIAQEGVVGGYPDGSYRPNHCVTRDQMAAYIARAFGLVP
jgi:hypothetical protein